MTVLGFKVFRVADFVGLRRWGCWVQGINFWMFSVFRVLRAGGEVSGFVLRLRTNPRHE